MKNYRNCTMWGIHAGRTGDAHSLFLQHNVIAIGWIKMSDLSKLEPTRDAFKAKLMGAVPDRKKGYYPMATGQIFRFTHELKAGDLVVYPSKSDRRIHIGEVTGSYLYNPGPEPGYPHHRPVKWLNEFPRTQFTQGALYEIGSAISFFQVKSYAEEFLEAIEGKTSLIGTEDDESVSMVAEEIEQTTKDYVQKNLADELEGHPFADFVAHLMNVMGYRTQVSPEGPDGGIDIIAHKDELGFAPPIIKIQVKSTEGSIGDPVVSQLFGKVEQGEFGMVVTLGTFTTTAKHFARNKSNLRLVDGDALVEMILQHYDNFNSKYKGLLPLKRVYVPEPLENTDS